MSKYNAIEGGILESPLSVNATSRSTIWSGITILASGSATVTQSTLSVKSDSLVLLGIQGPTNANSGNGMSVEVRSISQGNYFILGWSDGIAQPRSVNVHWMIVNQTP